MASGLRQKGIHTAALLPDYIHSECSWAREGKTDQRFRDGQGWADNRDEVLNAPEVRVGSETVSDNVVDVRDRIVVYNPSKGRDVTTRIIAALFLHAQSAAQSEDAAQSQDDQHRTAASLPPPPPPLHARAANSSKRGVMLVPIQHMASSQQLLARARVYIDFGHHPGQDRLPREAAQCGCVVVTGMRGSAGLFADVPLPQYLKIEEPLAELNETVARILAVTLRAWGLGSRVAGRGSRVWAFGLGCRRRCTAISSGGVVWSLRKSPRPSPGPHTLKPSWTLNPQPGTRNPKPETLNPCVQVVDDYQKMMPLMQPYRDFVAQQHHAMAEATRDLIRSLFGTSPHGVGSATGAETAIADAVEEHADDSRGMESGGRSGMGGG